MIVRIDSSLYSDKEKFNTLDQIVHIFVEGKHTWDISDPQIILNSPWMNIEGAGIRQRRRVEDLVKLSVKSAYIGKKQRQLFLSMAIIPDTNKENINSYYLQNAFQRLKDSAFIIVENINSDKAFIMAIAKAFNRNDIIESITREWVIFDSEGGKGGMPRRVEFHLNKPFWPRVLVIVDSDKENLEMDHKSQELIMLCDQKAVLHHVLYKREIENYIPVEAFDQLIEELNEVKMAYCSLNDEQMDFYDLKRGFKNKGKLPEHQAILFNQIDSKTQVFKALRNGFSTKKYNSNNLYLLFNNSDLVSQSNLLVRCRNHPNELIQILDKITRIL